MRNGASLAGDAARPSIKAPGSAMRLPVFLLTELRNLNKGTDGVEPPAAGRHRRKEWRPRLFGSGWVGCVRSVVRLGGATQPDRNRRGGILLHTEAKAILNTPSGPKKVSR
jgi:hypothetical protein